MFDLKSIRVGWFLGVRQLKRASLWSNILIITIMILTFLNLVVVSGLLVGLITGAEVAVQDHYIGDVAISTLTEKEFIENSQDVIAGIESTPGIAAYTARYLASARVEANYQERTDFQNKAEEVSSVVAGINPEMEDKVTGLSQYMIEGEYLNNEDFDKVLLGAYMLRKYLDIDSPGFLVLEDVEIGDKVKVKIGDGEREMIVKGFIKSKVDEVDMRLFMLDSQLRSMVGRDDMNVDEISIKLTGEYSPEWVRDALKNNGYDQWGKIQTFDEGKPKFLVDIKNTFNLLGNIISSIGLLVAAITVFIVIFINAITRRKFIGIMKAIGVNGEALEIAYIVQSMFYAIVGSAVGLVLVYILLVPYFDANPINFPFSDGILVAPIDLTLIRVAILMVVTGLAGYLPARIIIKKNTLDSVLGRN
jgi:ABC-type lipoprotein release transport system permease subunit